MRIGVLTYYRVANFGANLQAVSTYKYLERMGHEPIFIHYMSRQLYNSTDGCYDENTQIKCHLDFIDSVIKRQTETCFTAEDVNNSIKKYCIDAIIVGSDAVLQHHPFLSRIYFPGNGIRRRLYIDHVNDERLYPNLFWGEGISKDVKRVLMSVSSQNSAYRLFGPCLKRGMKKALNDFTFISVRDTWTRDMVKSITGVNVPITPDPVFAFNENASDLIPEKKVIIDKFNLPDDYVLVSFLNVGIPASSISGLKTLFKEKHCVAFPTPMGVRFKHNFDYNIPLPLNPIDWYALIKYSQAYIGNNMHPIVVALSNGVPCFSVDNYSNYNILRNPVNDGASKIFDLLKKCGLLQNHIVPSNNNVSGLENRIVESISSFPKTKIQAFSQDMLKQYNVMMDEILKSFEL